MSKESKLNAPIVDLSRFEAIIFDLGGVILNIDYHLSANAFKAIGAEDFYVLYSQAKQSDLFDRLEIGAIDAEDFRKEVREIFRAKWTKQEIDSAWNAMLLDLPSERLELLKELSNTRRIFLLSNTNEIHYDAYSEMLREKFGLKDLSELFEAAYFSHQIGMRKPDLETFNHLIQENGLDPKKTLFIDDSIQNIEGAKAAGISSYHLNNGDIIDLFAGQ